MEEKQLKGKSNGWFLTCLGITICIASVIFYAYSMRLAKNLEFKAHNFIQKVKTDRTIPQDNRNVKRALNIIDDLSEGPKVSTEVLSLFICCIGVLLSLKGVLYLRISSILNKTNLNKKMEDIC